MLVVMVSRSQGELTGKTSNHLFLRLFANEGGLPDNRGDDVNFGFRV